jgi:hypothetical protein
MGGAGRRRASPEDRAEAIEDGLGDEEAEEFQESFDTLPATVQSPVYRFIGIDGGGSFKPARDDKILRSSPTLPTRRPISSSTGAARPPSASALLQVASS